MKKIPLKPRTSIQKNCELCNDLFWVEVHTLKRGSGKFCSAKCRSIGIFTPEVLKKMSDHSARKGKIPKNFKKTGYSYNSIHNWVKRHYGKASKCVECGTREAKKYEWANISGNYLRDINDFKELCASCHAKFDNRGNRTWITRRKNKK